MSVCLSVCLSVFLPACLSVCLSTYLYVYLSINPFVKFVVLPWSVLWSWSSVCIIYSQAVWPNGEGLGLGIERRLRGQIPVLFCLRVTTSVHGLDRSQTRHGRLCRVAVTDVTLGRSHPGYHYTRDRGLLGCVVALHIGGALRRTFHSNTV